MSSILLFVGLANSASAFAQRDMCLHRTVPVNTLTGKGRRYAALAADDLRASLHGKPVRIVSTQPNTSAPRVMIVIDASGSMLVERKGWTLNLSIARALLQYVPVDSLAGLAVFSKTLESHLPPTRDREKLRAEIDRVSTYYDSAPRGRRVTALWDALNAVIADFEPARLGDSIVVITDGGDNASSTPFKSVKSAVLIHGLRIFASDFEAHQGGPTPEERGSEPEMRELVEASGGYAVSLEQPLKVPASGIALNGAGEAELLLELQMRQLVAYYRVEVELPESLVTPQGWKLQAKSPKLGNLTVFYPRTLMPCSAVGATAEGTP
jgi:hypothetical protein